MSSWSYIYVYSYIYKYIYFFYVLASAAAAKLLQSCLTLCDPRDGNPPGSPIPGILQARTLEWGAISFSNAWKWKVKVKSLSGVRLLATPWTAAHQAPPSIGFSRQEYWSRVPMPSPLFGASLTKICPKVIASLLYTISSWRTKGFIGMLCFWLVGETCISKDLFPFSVPL